MTTAIQHLTALVELHLSIEGQLGKQWGFGANPPGESVRHTARLSIRAVHEGIT